MVRFHSYHAKKNKNEKTKNKKKRNLQKKSQRKRRPRVPTERLIFPFIILHRLTLITNIKNNQQ